MTIIELVSLWRKPFTVISLPVWQCEALTQFTHNPFTGELHDPAETGPSASISVSRASHSSVPHSSKKETENQSKIFKLFLSNTSSCGISKHIEIQEITLISHHRSFLGGGGATKGCGCPVMPDGESVPDGRLNIKLSSEEPGLYHHHHRYHSFVYLQATAGQPKPILRGGSEGTQYMQEKDTSACLN